MTVTLADPTAPPARALPAADAEGDDAARPIAPQGERTAVTLHGVAKRFDRYPALEGVDLEVRPGELLALLGPSGSGKTTLLRILAGLEFPEAGRVDFGGQDVTRTPAAQRRVGFVFQQYALFRHMSVAKNIAFGMEVRRRTERPTRAERTRRVDELLGLVELSGLGGRYPAQLSGGQRQRVALARALAVSPRVLLLDEPFGALDATVRKSLRRELRRIHDATGVTTVFVTHDQEEALELADRVAVLNKGRLEQVGTPSEVYDRPASAFVAGFVGQSNRLEGGVEAGVFRSAGAVLEAAGVADGPAVAFVRPDQLVPASEGLAARVVRVVATGPMVRIEAEADGRMLESLVVREQLAARPAPGDAISLIARAGHVFPAR